MRKINLSDFFDFSDFGKLKNDLERISKAVKESFKVESGLFGKVKEEFEVLASSMKKSLSELDPTLKTHQKKIADIAKVSKELATAFKGLESEHVKSQQATKKSGKANEELFDTLEAGVNSIDSLKKELNALVKQYNALSDAERESARGKELETAIKQRGGALKELNNDLRSIKNGNETLAQSTKKATTALVDNTIKEIENTEALRANAIANKATAKEIGIYDKKLEELNKDLVHFDTINKQQKATTSATKGSYNELSREVASMEKALKAMPEVFGRNAKAAQKLAETIEKNKNKLKEFDSNIGNFQRNVGNYKSAFEGLGKASSGFLQGAGVNLLMGGGLAAAAMAFGSGLKSAVKSAQEFEKSMSLLGSITKASAEDLAFYEVQAERIGATTTLSAKQAADAFTLIGSKLPELLKNREALVGVTDAAVTLAEAANIDLVPAADAIASAINQLGLDASESGRIINALAAAATEGSAGIAEVAASMDKAGSVMKLQKIPLEDGLALIEQLAPAGFKGAEAGTALRNVLSTLANAKALPPSALKEMRKFGVDVELVSDSSKKVSERLKELGKISKDTTALTKVFGRENMVAGAQLLANADSLDELSKRLTGTNEAYRQAKNNTDNLDGSMKSFMSIVESAAISIGKQLIPSLRWLLGFLGDVINFTAQLGKAFGGLVGIVKDFFTGMIGATSAQRALKDSFEQSNKAIAEQSAGVEVLFKQLEIANITEEERIALIDEINSKYGKYLDNMLTEASTAEEIAAARVKINNALIEEIRLQAKRELATKLIKDQIELQMKTAEVAKKLGTTLGESFSPKIIETSVMAIAEYKNAMEDTGSQIKALSLLSKKYSKEQLVAMQSVIDARNKGLGGAFGLGDSAFDAVIVELQSNLRIVGNLMNDVAADSITKTKAIITDVTDGIADGINDGTKKGVKAAKESAKDINEEFKNALKMQLALSSAFYDNEALLAVGNADELSKIDNKKQKELFEIRKHFMELMLENTQNKLGKNSEEYTEMYSELIALELNYQKFLSGQSVISAQEEAQKTRLELAQEYYDFMLASQERYNSESLLAAGSDQKAKEKITKDGQIAILEIELEYAKYRLAIMAEIGEQGTIQYEKTLKEIADLELKLAEFSESEPLKKSIFDNWLNGAEQLIQAIDKLAGRLGDSKLKFALQALAASGEVITTIGKSKGTAIKGFRSGGGTGSTIGVNDIAGVVHGNEFVINSEITSKLGLADKDMNYFKSNVLPSIDSSKVSHVIVKDKGVDMSGLAREIGKSVASAIPMGTLEPFAQYLALVEKRGNVKRRYVINKGVL